MIDRDYKCVIYLGTVIKNRRGKENLALSKKWPKMHFEEKILEKKHVYIFNHFSYKNILSQFSR